MNEVLDVLGYRLPRNFVVVHFLMVEIVMTYTGMDRRSGRGVEAIVNYQLSIKD